MAVHHRRSTVAATREGQGLPAFHGGGIAFTEGVRKIPTPRRQYTVASSAPSTLEGDHLPSRRRSSTFLNGRSSRKPTSNIHKAARQKRLGLNRKVEKDEENTYLRAAVLVVLFVATLLPWVILVGTRTRLTQQIQLSTQSLMQEAESFQSELDLQMRLNHEHSAKVHHLENSNYLLLKKLRHLTREASSDVEKRTRDHDYEELEVEEEHILQRIENNHLHIKLSGRERLQQTYGYHTLPQVEFILSDGKVVSVELAPLNTNIHTIDHVLRWILEDRIWDDLQLSQPRSAAHQQQLHTIAAGLTTTTTMTRELAFLEHHDDFGRGKGRLCLLGKGPGFVIYLDDVSTTSPEEQQNNDIIKAEACFGQITSGLEHLKGQSTVQLERVRVFKLESQDS